jgi:MFS transporter, DHA1 family, staphyloferrin A biosynthesis exporter
MNMQQITRSLLIYRLSGSPLILGFMALANATPTLLLSLYGGALADRLPKKRVIQAGQAASALIALSVAIALTTGYMSPEHPGSWWMLIVNGFLQSTVQALMMPSRQAIIPELVGEDRLMNALALNSMGMNTLRLTAPAIAGFLIDLVGFEIVFYTMTGLYIMAIIITSFIPNSPQRENIVKSNALADIGAGVKYMLTNRTILLVLGFTLILVVLSMPYQLMLPIFADDILKVGATGMGVLQSIAGAGALVGSLILASLPNKRRGMILLGCGLLLGIVLVFFAYSHSYPLSMGLMVFIGLGTAGRQTLGSTLLQTYSEPEYLGRVMSVNMMDMGISSLGTFLVSVLTEHIGIERSIGGFAAALALLSLLIIIFIPKLRKLN